MGQRLSNHGVWRTLRSALALDVDLYESARNTPRMRRIALTIVILAAISYALGSAVILIINQARMPLLLLLLLLNGLVVVAGYYLWTFVLWKVGQWLKPIDPTYGDLLAPVGFAYAPQVLNLLTLIPLLGRPIELILAVWSLLAVIVAIRQGLDLSTRQATWIGIMGWVPIQLAIGLIQVLEQEWVRPGV
jgi:Yip1 domain